MQFRLLPALALCLSLLGAACTSSASRSAESKSTLKAPKQRRLAPDFALKDINGQTVRLSDLKGKVVLLNFWATWCGPCKIEIPWFMDFEQRFKDRGFAVVGVSMDDEGWEIVKPFLERLKVNYRVVIGNEEVSQAYGGVESLPTTLMIDREGRVASVHVGLVSRKEYEREIQELLDVE